MSIRQCSPFPQAVEDHVRSCDACTQYVSVAKVLSMTGRPSVQLPPVAVSQRIASMTYAKQGLWHQILAKPGVIVPAFGLLVAAGWLVSSRFGKLEVADNKAGIQVTPALSAPDLRSAPAQRSEMASIDAEISKDQPDVIVSSKPVDRLPKVKKRVFLVTSSATEKPLVTGLASVDLQRSPTSITPDVHVSEIAAANVGGLRVPEITTSLNANVDVQLPQSSRHSVGQTALVLASADEDTERDELRASFQSQLNQQSDTFRATNTHSSIHAGDSSRINVVNAPVVTGGK